jgi:hypothetical protein
MLGRLEVSGIAGSCCAKLRACSVDIATSVTWDKSKIPARASVVLEYLRTAE